MRINGPIDTSVSDKTVTLRLARRKNAMAINGSQCRLAFMAAKKEDVNATVRQLLITETLD